MTRHMVRIAAVVLLWGAGLLASCGGDPRPTDLGLYALVDGELLRLEPTENMAHAGAFGRFWHGPAEPPPTVLLDPQPSFTYFAVSAESEIDDLVLSRLEFVRDRVMDDLAGKRSVALDLFLPAEDVPLAVTPDAKDTRLFRLAPRSALATGVYAIHRGSLSSPAVGRLLEEPWFFVVDAEGRGLPALKDELFGLDTSLPPSAPRVLGAMGKPLTIRYYVTAVQDMPQHYRWLQRDTENLLKKLCDLSGGKLTATTIHPESDPAHLTELTHAGASAISFIDRDASKAGMIWSVVLVSDGETESTVPIRGSAGMADEARALLAQIAKSGAPTHRIVLHAPVELLDPKVAEMYKQQGLPPPSGVDHYATLVELLRNHSFAVDRVDLNEQQVTPAGDVLLVVEPVAFGPQQLCTVANALRSGVPVVLAIQRYRFDYRLDDAGDVTATATLVDSGLEELLASWGLAVPSEILMDERTFTVGVPREKMQGGLRLQESQPVALPIQIEVSGPDLDRPGLLTGRTEKLSYLWGAAVATDAAKLDAAELAVAIVATSSARSWLSPFAATLTGAGSWQRKPDQAAGRQPVALQVTGTFPAAPECPAGTSAPGRLILVGGAKWAQDTLLQVNSPFLLDLIETLVYGEEYAAIRR